MKNQNCLKCELVGQCYMQYREIDTHQQRYKRLIGCPMEYIERLREKKDK